MKFFKALKRKTEVNPFPIELDKKVFHQTKAILTLKKEKNVQDKKSSFLLITSLTMASLVIILFNQVEKQTRNEIEIVKNEMLIDPNHIELINLHEEIEIMSESADWSEEEWAIALGKEVGENS